ncbi:MAG: OmpA family protein [Planctomycetota bacterium]
MTAPRTFSLPLLMLALMTLAGVGCNRSYAERDALFAQNTAAQNEIDRLRLANDQLMVDLAAANTDNARLRRELEVALANTRVAPEPRPIANQPADTGFEGINDITADRTATRVTVNVASDILFASGKAELRDSAKQTLTQVAGVLKSEYAGREIHVVGYTDTDPIRRSGWDDNLELSLQRAASVHRFLDSQGLDAEQLVAAGRGATNLLSTKAASRRVEIIVILSE